MNDSVMVKVGDVMSLALLLGYAVNVLPVLATTLTIIWTALRIYEMCTVQEWLKRRKCDADK